MKAYWLLLSLPSFIIIAIIIMVIITDLGIISRVQKFKPTHISHTLTWFLHGIFMSRNEKLIIISYFK